MPERTRINISIKDHREAVSYILFLVYFYFFLFRDPLEDLVPAAGYVDELVALCAVPLFFLRFARYLRHPERKEEWRRLRGSVYARCIVAGALALAVFLGAGLLSSFIFRYQPLKTALIDAFLCVKFWLALYVGSVAFSGLSLERYGKRIYGHIRLVVSLYCVLLVLSWTLGWFTDTKYRFGLPCTKLFYSHSTILNGCCVLLIMLLMLLREYARHYQIWTGMLCFLMLTTLRAKGWGGVAVALFLCIFILYRGKRVNLRYVVGLAAVLVALGWKQLNFYFHNASSDQARAFLTLRAIDVANDHFPFGAGFGTYGSAQSVHPYSPLYAMYGLDGLKGLEEGASQYVSDQFWPMILGQTGWIGLAAYAVLVVVLFIAISRLWRRDVSSYAAGLMGMCYLLICSTAESAFAHPVFVPVAMLFGFLLRRRRQEEPAARGGGRAGGSAVQDTKGRVFLCGFFRYPRGEAGAGYVRNLAKAFRESGYQPVVISDVDPELCPTDRTSEAEGITVVPCVLPEGRIRHSIDFRYRRGAYIRRRLRQCEAGREDVVLSCSMDPGILREVRTAALDAGARCGVCVEEWFGEEDDDPKGGRDHAFRRDRRSFCRISRTYDFILPVSSCIETFYREKGCSTFRIPFLSDTGSVPYREKDVPGKRILIYSANGTIRDTLPQVLQGLALLPAEERGNLELHLCGCASAAPALLAAYGLEHLIGEPIVIHPRMSCEELERLYVRAHFLLLPLEDCQMTRAGFPGAIPEALACGVIPVCTCVGDYTEYYLRDNVDSLQMSDCRAETVAGRIRDALSLTDRELLAMSANCRRTAEKSLDYHVWAPRLGAFLESLPS